MSNRPGGRAPDALRPLDLVRGAARNAEGSCLVSMGGTRVLCTASVQEGVPDRFADLLKQLDKSPTEGKAE